VTGNRGGCYGEAAGGAAMDEGMTATVQSSVLMVRDE
jgi:hypothetical protein